MKVQLLQIFFWWAALFCVAPCTHAVTDPSAILELFSKSIISHRAPQRFSLAVPSLGRVEFVVDRHRTQHLACGELLLFSGVAGVPYRGTRAARRSWISFSGRYATSSACGEGVTLYIESKGVGSITRYYQITATPSGISLARAPSTALSSHPCSAMNLSPSRPGGMVRKQTAKELRMAATSFSHKAIVLPIADHTMTSQYGSSTTARILGYLNQASTIYENTFSLTLVPNPSIELSATALPNSLNRSTDTIYALQSYGNQSFAPSSDIHHLYTRRTFADGPVGIAFRGTTCVDPGYSYSLTVDRNPALSPIITAHEIGHNLGADHAVNNISVGGIMSATLIAPYPQTFASQSQSQIHDFITQNGSCLDSEDQPALPKSPRAVLKIKSQARGKVTIEITIPGRSVPRGCVITVKAASPARGAPSGTILLRRRLDRLFLRYNISLGNFAPARDVGLVVQNNCTGRIATNSKTAIMRRTAAVKTIGTQNFLSRLSLAVTNR